MQTNLRDHLWVLPAFALPQTLGAASFQPLAVEAFTVIIPAGQRDSCTQTSLWLQRSHLHTHARLQHQSSTHKA